MNVLIPGTVSVSHKETFIRNFQQATHNTGRLFLFAGDQKVEHLNDDFVGSDISPESADPEHLFKIAQKSRIGAFATQLGLVARYGSRYPTIPYVIKISGKTNLVSSKQMEPVSHQWTTVDQVVAFQKNTGLNILGVGMTVYLGSEYEGQMLADAAQMVLQAHAHGLLAIVWVYPRGKAVSNERTVELIAGAAGVANCLGADFVKVNQPEGSFETVVAAAGNTGVLCSGGSKRDQRQFLEELHQQIHVGGTAGVAVGRNIHQRNLSDAVAFCDAIAAIVLDNSDVRTASAKLG